MDAHRREVFAALFEVSSGPMFTCDRLREVEGATVGEPSATLARWRNEGLSPALVIGDGAVLYADIVRRVLDAAQVVAAPPLAGAIGLLALERARRGEAIGPAAIHPLYVRRPDAELAREHALAHRRADVARPD
jgi:tRNA A37 threonylcarbamoyladenosine modification protein TsaB